MQIQIFPIKYFIHEVWTLDWMYGAVVRTLYDTLSIGIIVSTKIVIFQTFLKMPFLCT
jgi:hypothetical protein